jgi:hypothetical protein
MIFPENLGALIRRFTLYQLQQSFPELAEQLPCVTGTRFMSGKVGDKMMKMASPARPLPCCGPSPSSAGAHLRNEDNRLGSKRRWYYGDAMDSARTGFNVP